MTREEQIHNEATNYGYAIAGGCLERAHISKAFQEGAEWADRNSTVPLLYEDIMEKELVFTDFTGSKIKCTVKELIHRHNCYKRSSESYQKSQQIAVWNFIGRKINDDFQPDVPKVDEQTYNRYVIPGLIRAGAISKKDLVIGKKYKGYCRNASEAIWLGDKFEYIRTKFGDTFTEKINHFEDDNGFDLFVPYELLD